MTSLKSKTSSSRTSSRASYDVVVVGAGISGLWAARRLRDAGRSVLVVEKARGSGGRLSSKRLSLSGFEDERDVPAPEIPEQIGIDLGCSSFSLDAAIASELKSKVSSLVFDTASQSDQNWLAEPRNSALTRSLLGTGEARFGTRVMGLSRSLAADDSAELEGHCWKVSVESGDSESDQVHARQVVISAPPEQASALLPDGHPNKVELASCLMRPQWVCVIATDSPPVNTNWREELLQDPAVTLCCIENLKPGRLYPENVSALVLHFSPDWSAKRLERNKQDILVSALSRLESSRGHPVNMLASHVHRWLYSLPPEQSFGENHCDFSEGLGLCGDYWGPAGSGGVERALYSADALVNRMLLDDQGSLSKSQQQELAETEYSTEKLVT